MKKILFITTHLSGRGGTETVLSTVVRLLVEKKYEYVPKIFVLGGSTDKNWMNDLPHGESRYYKNSMLRNMAYFFTLIKLLKEERPEIVVGLDPLVCLFTNIIRKTFLGRYIIFSWIHFSLFHSNVRANLIPKADYHLSISSGISRQLSDLGIQQDRVFTVFNPVIHTVQTIERPVNGTTFIFLGRIYFEGQKRLKDLLDTLSHVEGNWTLEIFGDGIDMEKCRIYAKQLNLAPYVHWNGFVPRPWDKISRATALILTSAYEGMPMVLAEAIARGVYCISADCETGPEDIIIEKINGELYPAGDLKALERKLQDIVNGQTLPDQEAMKASLGKFHLDQYYLNFTGAISSVMSAAPLKD
ncbi:glycosyltransferase [Sporolactobacillus pectinivorans]|uniref:glycosyltransferase n=1 Tax=Sporolactobacillus pectinivorans TaxID=1591408 RepID=UPI0012FDFB07|nr:glycosyltransferase [Sporolactobacillus pectinivorans]